MSPSRRQGSEAGAALQGGGREDIHCRDHKSSLGRAPALWPWVRPMEISSPKTSEAKENLSNTCSFPIPFIFHLGRLGLLKLHRGRFERLRVCFCESCANLAAFPNSHLLDVSEFIHPRILWELLTLCTAHTAQVLLLVYHPSLGCGIPGCNKMFLPLTPKVCLPRSQTVGVFGCVARHVVQRGAFSQRKAKFCSCSENQFSFLHSFFF